MNTDMISRAVSETVEALFKSETLKIWELYKCDRLITEEKSTLVGLSIGIGSCAENAIKKMMADLGVRFANTAWREIEEKLPQIVYRYINWDAPEGTHGGAQKKEKLIMDAFMDNRESLSAWCHKLSNHTFQIVIRHLEKEERCNNDG